VVASLARVDLNVQVADEAIRTSKEWKQKNAGDKLPMLETEDGCFTDTVAILKHLARLDVYQQNLLGESVLAQAQVQQWISLTKSQINPCVSIIAQATFGQGKQ
jgi:glutathione S-transferase